MGFEAQNPKKLLPVDPKSSNMAFEFCFPFLLYHSLMILSDFSKAKMPVLCASCLGECRPLAASPPPAVERVTHGKAEDIHPGAIREKEEQPSGFQEDKNQLRHVSTLREFPEIFRK